MAVRLRRIAMWSGPRNISTAMMRSWGNRADTFVCDEPLYAHYLLQTGAPHPGADEVIRHHETDWKKVTEWLRAYEPPGKAVFYQKHMSHHLLPDIGRDWLNELIHVFLIRDPRRSIQSFTRIAGTPDIEQTGLPQQMELFSTTRRRMGYTPPVVDARDVLENPARVLGLLCKALDVVFDDRMLSWPAGPRDTDGVWARYWYDTVLQSTGFNAGTPDNEDVPAELTGLMREAEVIYRALHEHRIH